MWAWHKRITVQRMMDGWIQTIRSSQFTTSRDIYDWEKDYCQSKTWELKQVEMSTKETETDKDEEWMEWDSPPFKPFLAKNSSSSLRVPAENKHVRDARTADQFLFIQTLTVPNLQHMILLFWAVALTFLSLLLRSEATDGGGVAQVAEGGRAADVPHLGLLKLHNAVL